MYLHKIKKKKGSPSRRLMQNTGFVGEIDRCWRVSVIFCHEILHEISNRRNDIDKFIKRFVHVSASSAIIFRACTLQGLQDVLGDVPCAR